MGFFAFALFNNEEEWECFQQTCLVDPKNSDGCMVGEDFVTCEELIIKYGTNGEKYKVRKDMCYIIRIEVVTVTVTPPPPELTTIQNTELSTTTQSSELPTPPPPTTTQQSNTTIQITTPSQTTTTKMMTKKE